MHQVNLYEAKTQLSKLVDEAAAGGEVIIARAGKPIARLTAYREIAKPRRPGHWRGRVRLARDFDVLPAGLRAAFRGEEP